MSRRIRWRWFFVAFTIMCAGSGAYYVIAAPTILRLAVGPEGSQLHRHARLIAEALSDAGQPYRLKIVATAGVQESSAALDAHKADLAILRSDDFGGKEAQSVAILQRLSLIVLVRKDRNISRLEDIKGRKIAIVATGDEPNKPLVERLLQHFGLGPNDVSIIAATQPVAGKGVTDGEFDAIVLVLNAAGARARRVVSTLLERNENLQFFKIEASEALAARFREVAASEIPAGIFGGVPLRPPAVLETVALTYELVARASLSVESVAGFARAVMSVRSRLLRDEGREFVMEAPSLEETRRFEPHAGTANYVNGDIKTFLEIWSDYIWLALFGFSLLGTSVTAFLGWVGGKDAPESEGLLRALPGVIDEIDAAQSVRDLSVVESKLDNVVKAYVRDAASGRYDPDNQVDPGPMLRLMAELVQRRRAALQALAGAGGGE